MKTLKEFIDGERESKGGEFFNLEGPHLLEVNLKGNPAWAKVGTMVAHVGEVKIKRESSRKQGIGTFIKKKLTGEGMTLMRMVSRQAKVYLAEQAKYVHPILLTGDSIFVNGNDLLAFGGKDGDITWDVVLMKGAGIASGGFFNVKLEGSGPIALMTHGDPIGLPVSPGKPVYTDPHATVAWAASLTPKIVVDYDFKAFIGKRSGEEVKMEFKGNGWVLVQPFEEVITVE